MAGSVSGRLRRPTPRRERYRVVNLSKIIIVPIVITVLTVRHDYNPRGLFPHMSIRGTREALQLLQEGETRKVTTIGNSIGITLPEDAVEKGDTVVVRETDDGNIEILTPD